MALDLINPKEYGFYEWEAVEMIDGEMNCDTGYVLSAEFSQKTTLTLPEWKDYSKGTKEDRKTWGMFA